MPVRKGLRLRPISRYTDADMGSGHRRMGKLAFIVAVGLAPAFACAHAIVMSASPAVDARVPPGPVRIRLEFNSRIDLDRSRIMLQGPDNADRPVALSHDEPVGTLAGSANLTLTGPWKLRWQVLSADGHITRGEIPFRVDDAKR